MVHGHGRHTGEPISEPELGPKAAAVDASGCALLAAGLQAVAVDPSLRALVAACGPLSSWLYTFVLPWVHTFDLGNVWTFPTNHVVVAWRRGCLHIAVPRMGRVG